MKLDFDIGNVEVTEFGVGKDKGGGQAFVVVPVDANVQSALHEMVQATWDALLKDENGPAKYEPSEKYGSTEYIYLPLDDDLATSIRDLHKAVNLNIDATALDDPSDLFCYFVRMTDNKMRRLTALRRSAQFKGVLKKRLIRFVSDSLKLIDDHVFKLDNDFDFLIDLTNVHILRPSGFEFTGNLQAAVLEAVPLNVEELRKHLKFVDLESIQAYACRHPRAARYLASIRSRKWMEGVDRGALKDLCMRTGVAISEDDGKIQVEEGQVMGFLEVLDRRRYEVELVKEMPEQFKAASRRQIDGQG